MDTYKVIRIYMNLTSEVIATGLTLAEAMEYCDNVAPSDDWFDGYSKEEQ